MLFYNVFSYFYYFCYVCAPGAVGRFWISTYRSDQAGTICTTRLETDSRPYITKSLSASPASVAATVSATVATTVAGTRTAADEYDLFAT